ncbi:hypothetical protein M5K25_023007 [Dendrobium thyrsiflorum]|uniref:Uncharacterized protein n=1 Tax=Dendrobium thyrsiflorum TaxID=117978 RepID=A0ABD0UE16_DENTH
MCPERFLLNNHIIFFISMFLLAIILAFCKSLALLVNKTSVVSRQIRCSHVIRYRALLSRDTEQYRAAYRVGGDVAHFYWAPDDVRPPHRIISPSIEALILKQPVEDFLDSFHFILVIHAKKLCNYEKRNVNAQLNYNSIKF